MVKNKIKGNILNIASSSSLRPAISAYIISKWGIKGFTQNKTNISQVMRTNTNSFNKLVHKIYNDNRQKQNNSVR